MTSEEHLMADWFFGLLLVAILVGIGLWIWRTKRESALAALGYWALVWAVLAGGQLAARGVTAHWLWIAAVVWASLTAATALLLGIRHLLSGRQSRQITE